MPTFRPLCMGLDLCRFTGTSMRKFRPLCMILDLCRCAAASIRKLGNFVDLLAPLCVSSGLSMFMTWDLCWFAGNLFA